MHAGLSVAGQVHGISSRSFADPMHGLGPVAQSIWVSPQPSSAIVTSSPQNVFVEAPFRARRDGPSTSPPEALNWKGMSRRRITASPATLRKTLRPGDLADEVAAKRAENRIAAEVPEQHRPGVRGMLRALRHRLLGR